MIDVNDLAALLRASSDAKANPAGGRQYIVLRDGNIERIEYLEIEPVGPMRAKGAYKVRTAQSFVALFKELSATTVVGVPRVYMQPGPPPRFVAVMNDHGERSGHRDLRIDFQVPFSVEWDMWTPMDRKPMDQDAFAAFLEDRIADIATPPGADLLSLVLAFEETRTMVFKSSKRLQDGSQQIVMGSTADASGSTLKIPSVIRLNIPVLEGDAPRNVDVRLKYRVLDQKLKFIYEIELKHRIIKAALDDAAAAITSGTGQLIIEGAS